jgi:hypothetical protein
MLESNLCPKCKKEDKAPNYSYCIKCRRDYERVNYQKHASEIRERKKLQMRKLREDHPEIVSARHKKWYKNNKESVLERNLRRRLLIKNRIEEIIGKYCSICGKDNECFHEIHGREHVHSYKYILDNINDFVPLCYKCHKGLHVIKSFNKIENKNERKLIELLSLLR